MMFYCHYGGIHDDKYLHLLLVKQLSVTLKLYNWSISEAETICCTSADCSLTDF